MIWVTGVVENTVAAGCFLVDTFDCVCCCKVHSRVCVTRGSAGICVMVAAVTVAIGRVRAAWLLHEDVLLNVLRSPQRFFDVTPTGRVLNRFSKDVNVIDVLIPMTMTTFVQTSLGTLCTVGVIGYSTPLFLTVFVPLGVVYYLIQVPRTVRVRDNTGWFGWVWNKASKLWEVVTFTRAGPDLYCDVVTHIPCPLRLQSYLTSSLLSRLSCLSTIDLLERVESKSHELHILSQNFHPPVLSRFGLQA